MQTRTHEMAHVYLTCVQVNRGLDMFIYALSTRVCMYVYDIRTGQWLAEAQIR